MKIKEEMVKRASFRRAAKKTDAGKVKSGELNAALLRALGDAPQSADKPEPVASSPKRKSPPGSPRRSGGSANELTRPGTSVKKPRVEPADDSAAKKTSATSSESKAFHWSYEHKKNSPVIKDPEGMAQLVRHFKDVGCQLPPLRSIPHRDAYVAMARAHGEAMAANNHLIALLNADLAKGIDREELDSAQKVVGELTAQLRRYQEAEAANAQMAEEYEALKERVAQLETCHSEAQRKLTEAEGELAHLRKLYNASEEQLAQAAEVNKKLAASQEKEMRRAVRSGRREVASNFGGALAMVNAFFAKKEKEAEWNTKAQEVVANLDMLQQILDKEIEDLPAEMEKLKKSQFEIEKEYLAAKVPAFQLTLPQVSEDTQEDPIEVPPGKEVPAGLDEFGTNLPEPVPISVIYPDGTSKPAAGTAAAEQPDN